MRSGIRRKESFWTISAFLLLALFPPALAWSGESIYGFGFFAAGVILLEIREKLAGRRAWKVGGLAVYLLAVPAILWGLTSATFILPLFTIVMLGALRLAARDIKQVKIVTKPRLSLSEQGLSTAEAAYVRSAVAGVSYKEIASNAGISESTVRNTLARAYRKLGVTDKAALVALVDAHELMD